VRSAFVRQPVFSPQSAAGNTTSAYRVVAVQRRVFPSRWFVPSPASAITERV
jgi:hypothetical protein